MKKFYTKFELVPHEVTIYNPVDKVDRLTYVDTTQQITRMLQAGVNLKLRANQGLSGEDFNAPAMPIYSPDVALSQKMINDYKEELKANAEKRSAEYAASVKAADPLSSTGEKNEPTNAPA